MWPDSKQPHKCLNPWISVCIRRREKQENIQIFLILKIRKRLVDFEPRAQFVLFKSEWGDSRKESIKCYETPCALCSPPTVSCVPRGREYKSFSQSSHSLRSATVTTNKPIILLWCPHPTSQTQKMRIRQNKYSPAEGWPSLVPNSWCVEGLCVALWKRLTLEICWHLCAKKCNSCMFLFFGVRQGLVHGLEEIKEELHQTKGAV